MPGCAAATIPAIGIGLMIRRHGVLGPEFGQHGDGSAAHCGAIVDMLCRMRMRHAAMSSRAGRRKRDQKQCCEGQDGRCDGPDGHDAFYIIPGFGKSGSARTG
jgi:hypothetical protein